MKKILKFYSKTCGPCMIMGNKLAQLKDVEINNIDVFDGTNTDLISKWNIRSVPTIIVLSEDNKATEFRGIVPIEQIQEALNGKQITD